jgi:selenocysteine-specific elongation factor
VDRHIVIGTAGHIDHGKTTLVKALTGVDTDRLAEEKRRGITIDLGFAPIDLDGQAASVVDVPGHEGFIKNMVAGATGVDLALLVVAADEGVMPQTTEHLAILRFLGVSHGVVALAKVDLAPDREWQQLVAEEIASLIERDFGNRWPVVPVSAARGDGLDELRRELAAAASRVASRSSEDRFRLPVDRVFSLPGAGTIVTGTVWSGRVSEGDEVHLLPDVGDARVRSIQVHGAGAPVALPGRRAALALVGSPKGTLARGAVVVSGDGWTAARAIDVALSLLPGVVIKPRARVRVHHGTSEVMARVVLDRSASPGDRVPARLFLESGLVARSGDRLVIRSYSPVTTIGGGVVVDPCVDAIARARGRRVGPAATPESDGERVRLLVARRGTAGMDRPALEVAGGLDATRLTAALSRGAELGLVERDGWFVARDEIERIGGVLRSALDRFHREHPMEAGMPVQAWRAAAGAVREQAIALAEERLVEVERAVARQGSLVRSRGWEPGSGQAAQAARGRVLTALASADAEPPSVQELAASLPGIDVPAVLRLLAREGAVVAVARDRYYEAGALVRERERLEGVLREIGEATPAQLRDRLGRSRKWLIPLLEWADREGVTVRRGDVRVLKLTKDGA